MADSDPSKRNSLLQADSLITGLLQEVMLLTVSTVVVVVVVITPPLPRDGGTTRTAIQVHAVNLIKIRLEVDSSPFQTSHE